jgi:hypothetical protein
MFWKKRKPREEEIAEQLNAEAARVVEILKGKWGYYQTTLTFRADVPLATQIELFMMPAREGILENVPIMRLAPNAPDLGDDLRRRYREQDAPGR